MIGKHINLIVYKTDNPNKKMTKDEIKHINWIYNRLTSVHKENPNFDYMKRFKEIIDKELTLYNVVRF